MHIYSIIEKKRDGGTLTREELAFFVRGLVGGTIADYQTAALLMAMFIRGMDAAETLALTQEMAGSGDVFPLRPDISDKHSTGGIGDTTTLVLLPLVMAAGGKMAKLSGRGLGFTGGTIDKLSAIPGFRTNLSGPEFEAQLEKIGCVLTAQTANIAPADKILYALRDVTATVDSLPLIAASIMSKKLALGAGKIILDVKVGSGAFMKTEEEALALARLMVDIGKGASRDTRALVTRMDAPLGDAIGNTLEVMEAIAVLQGKKGTLREVSVALAALLTGASREKLETLLDSGAALSCARRFIEAQGGEPNILSDFSHFKPARFTRRITLREEGFITKMDAAALGRAACLLGAGRVRKEDEIDPSAGIRMHKSLGDGARGVLCELYTDREETLSEAEEKIRAAVQIEKENIAVPGIIVGMVE